jgi:hypothetical protein
MYEPYAAYIGPKPGTPHRSLPPLGRSPSSRHKTAEKGGLQIWSGDERALLAQAEW